MIYPFLLPFSYSTAAFRPILARRQGQKVNGVRAINGGKKSNKKLGQSIASVVVREKALPKSNLLINNARLVKKVYMTCIEHLT